MGDDLPAALEKIHERYRSSFTALRGNVAHEESADDVPDLLAALRAVLELADTWDAEAGRLGTRHQRYRAFKSCADGIREAITRALTGQ